MIYGRDKVHLITYRGLKPSGTTGLSEGLLER